MMDKIKQGSIRISLKDRLFTFGYGMGASVVIIGVLFKLMYWEGADVMLTVGLITEALVFATSAFEKPFKTYEWDKLFDFESGQIDLNLDNGTASFKQAYGHSYGVGVPASGVPSSGISGVSGAPEPYPITHSQSATPISAMPISGTEYYGDAAIPGLSTEDAQNLSQSVKNFANAANKLNEIASVSDDIEKFAESIKEISVTTSKYAQSQEGLIQATSTLHRAYERLNADTEKIEANTQEYRNKVERINNNLAGMNSIYEILLKDIHAQSVNFSNQTAVSKQMAVEMEFVTKEMGKLRDISGGFTVATQNIRANATELSETIAKLNAIYGNMLNSVG